MQIIDFLQTRSLRAIVVLAVLFLVLIGILDYLTGSELSMSIFYLIPVVLLAQFVNRRAGIMMSIAAAVVWMIVELAGGRPYSSDVIPYWNAGVRLSFFLIITFTIAAQRAALLRQEELSHFVVHDLRSPISNALSGLQYLDALGDDAGVDERSEILHISMSSCNRTLTLINTLLDLARLESGKLELNIRQVAVGDLFDLAFQQIEALARRNDVRVTPQIHAGAASVLVDAEITMRVLVNLIGNALKYSPQGSTVVIAAEPHDSEMVAISVADKGAGIPAEWKDRVFDKFAQVEAHQKGVAIGSGLGLSFCRLAVQSQGGRIWVESTIGQGTTVFFTAPRADRNPLKASV